MLQYDPPTKTLYMFSPLPVETGPTATLVLNGQIYRPVEPMIGSTSDYWGRLVIKADDEADDEAAEADNEADEADDEAELPSYPEITKLVAAHYAAMIEAGAEAHQAFILTQTFQAALLESA